MALTVGRPTGVRLLLAMLFALALQSLAPAAYAADAPFCPAGQAPGFVLGFARLRTALGPTMGEPLECEHTNSANGDALQTTTTGLAFYRKATNTPTFTDGYNHWALTANGPVTWVGASADPPASALAPAAPPAPATPLAPRGGQQCLQVGASRCLVADADVVQAISVLGRTRQGPDLLRTAANAGVAVRMGESPPRTWGDYTPRARRILLSDRLRVYSATEQAPVLAHELQHVQDFVQRGRELQTEAGCFATEDRAFRTQADVWVQLSGGRLQPPRNDLDRELNLIAQTIERNPQGFADRLAQLYQEECSG